MQSGSSKWHFRGGSCGDMLLWLVNRTKELQDLSLGHPDSPYVGERVGVKLKQT